MNALSLINLEKALGIPHEIFMTQKEFAKWITQATNKLEPLVREQNKKRMKSAQDMSDKILF